MTVSSPYWWQRLLPTYGNWGGIGWSAGTWNNDPAQTDWSVAAIDEMDELFKWHDWAYQHGFALDAADWALVQDFRDVRPGTVYGKFYRLLAMTSFTVCPAFRSTSRRMTMKRFAFVLAAFLVVCAAVFAGPVSDWHFAADVVPGISPLDFPVPAMVVLQAPQQAHWIWTALTSEVIVVVAGWAFCWILDRIKDSRIRRALLAIKTAVTVTYQEYVRAVKALAPDGKLTVDQKNEALQYAYRKAVELAKSDGIDLLKVFAKETILAIIEKFVGESKAPAVLGPLADLPA